MIVKYEAPDWGRRQEALQHLRQNGGIGRAELISEGLDLLDDVLGHLDLENGSSFERVAALTLCKARRYAFGLYSLILDGLGQEAGAMARPLLECTEMLAYFVDDPDRVKEAIDGRLPSAGNIAQAIDGRFKFLRDYWSDHASHFSFTHEAVGHLIDFHSFEARPVDPIDPGRLRWNSLLVIYFLWLLSVESVNVLSRAGKTRVDVGATVDRAERYRRVAAASVDAIKEGDADWGRDTDE